MVEYLPIIWFLTAGLIPAALLIIGIINVVKKVRITEIIIKLFIAFVFYVPITIVCGAYVASLINNIEDTKGITVEGVRGVPTPDSTSVVMILGYIIFGLILCWFVNKNLLKILSFITGSEQTTCSIFDEK